MLERQIKIPLKGANSQKPKSKAAKLWDVHDQSYDGFSAGLWELAARPLGVLESRERCLWKGLPRADKSAFDS